MLKVDQRFVVGYKHARRADLFADAASRGLLLQRLKMR
jgi:hypothetical protein